MSLFEELKRRKVFRLAAAYLVVAWLIIQVVDAIKEPLNLPDWFHTVIIVLLGLLFPIALMLSWAYDVTPDGVVNDDDSGAKPVRVDYGKISLGAVIVLGAFLAGNYVTDSNSGRDTGNARTQATLLQRFRLDVTSSIAFDTDVWRSNALTPDGQIIVIHAEDSDGTFLMSRTLDQLDFVRISGTDNADGVFAISADSQSVVFHDTVDNLLKKTPIDGGPSAPITHADEYVHTLSWGINGNIVFGTSSYRGLWFVNETGGDPEMLTDPDSDTYHKQARFIPGSEMLVLSVGYPGLSASRDDRIALLTPDGEIRMTDVAGASPRATPDGYITYLSEGAVWATKLDMATGNVDRTPIALAENVRYGGRGLYDVSHEGTMIYAAHTLLENTVVLVDHSGIEQEVPLEPGNYGDPMVSPDGDQIAVVRGSPYGADLWLYSMDGTQSDRITNDNSLESSPTWGPDGRYLFFHAGRPGDIFRFNLEETGPPEQLTDTRSLSYPYSISTDERILFGYESPGLSMDANMDIGIIEFTPLAEAPEYRPLLDTLATERSPAISPDGNWLAYESNESGRGEIYVRRYPITNARPLKISKDGGGWPAWHSEGRVIYYLGETDVMSVAIETEPELRHSEPEALFNRQHYKWNEGSYYYTAEDKFVFATRGFEHSSDQIVFVRDWRDLLREATE